MGTRENKVERYLAEEIKKIGGISRKWVCPTYNGVPDQIVIIGGDIWFCEVKTIDGVLSNLQKRQHNRLQDNGVQVITLYGREDVDSFIEGFVNRL